MPLGITFGEAPEGVTAKLEPLQITAVRFDTTGVGFTLTVTVKVDPEHPFTVGVTV